MRLARRVSQVKPSPTIAMAVKARKMMSGGIDVIDLSVGEPDFDTPEPVKYAAIKALCDGVTKYTPASGTDTLKEAICQKLKEENGLDYQPEQIVASCGAKHALFNAYQALLDPGDEIIIPAPYWVSYPDMALICEAKPVSISTNEETDFLPTPEQIANAITPKTKLLVINSPCNPTGAVWSRELLEEVASIVLRHEELYVISDEIYEKLIYDEQEHISIASLGERIKERTILVNGLSKSFSMTGWRLGYAAAPSPIAKAMANIQSQSTTNPTSFVQSAAVAALQGPQDFSEFMREEFDRRRQFLVSALNEIPGLSCAVPRGAFYVFPNFKGVLERSLSGTTIKTTLQLTEYLLEKAHIAAVAGEAFGAPGYIRFSYATPMSNLQEAAKRLRAALA